MKRLDQFTRLEDLNEVRMPRVPEARMDTHVGVPLFWSAIVAALLTMLAIYVANVKSGRNWDPLLVFLIALVVCFLLTSTPSWWKFLFRAETRLGVDLNRDGQIGDPWDKHHLRVTIENQDDDLPLDTEELAWNRNSAIIFARSILNVDDLTEGRWGKRSSVFPQGMNQFRNIRSALEELGYLKRTGGSNNSTWTLTEKGRQVFRHIATLPRIEE